MQVGYMRVSSDGDRQVLNLQRDALLNVGVDERHLFEDHASGSRDDRVGLAKPWHFFGPATAWWYGSWSAWAGRCRICWLR
jgi:Resolvase, N terminal domain